MKHFRSKAFTLVELLIVIGIIGILAVTLLVNLNPAEAQRKARDSARMKDLSTIQAALEQFFNDGHEVTGGGSATGVLRESNAAGAATACNNNWIGENLCAYIRIVPMDPRNGVTIQYVFGTTGGFVTTQTPARYRVHFALGGYKASAIFESTSNAAKLINDGGISATWFEVYSNSAIGV